MITTLNIPNFLGKGDLKIEGLKRINLICGDNGIGKSTILKHPQEPQGYNPMMELWWASKATEFRLYYDDGELVGDYISQHKFICLDDLGHHVHHRRLKAMWEFIDAQSKEHNLQIFATTHSLDVIRAFSDVIEADDGLFMRLEQSKMTGDSHKIVPTCFKNEQLVKLLDAGLEVR